MNEKIIGFIGLGLMGGSLAKAIRKAHPEWRLMAYDANGENTARALREDIIQEVCPDVDASFAVCDYIFLCAPVSANAENLLRLKEIKKDGCLLTDVGSVKSDIHQTVAALGLEDCFIGGHPMAGSEKTGYHNAKAQLLENVYYILTPAGEVGLTMITDYTELVTSIGAIPMIITYEEHDYITAAVSHLPHVIAASLVNLVRDLDNEEEMMKSIAAGGFKDITRIASSSPVMWQQICMSNSENISKVLDAYIRSLIQFRVDIDNHNSEQLFRLFAESQEYRNSLPVASFGPIKKAYQIYCDIPDETGCIAAIATLLAKQQINLKNIGIIHNREFEQGALRIEFYGEASAVRAASLLREQNYTVYES